MDLAESRKPLQQHFLKQNINRCIVHQVRNTLKYVADKDRKAFSADLKTIYHAPDEKKVQEALKQVTEKWSSKYPNSMKCWYDSKAEEIVFIFD